MNKDYKFPINLFIILEHAAPLIYTSHVLQNGHFFILLEKKFLKSSMNIFKNEYNFWKSTLIENSAVDTLEYNKYTKEFEIFFKNSRILNFYILYFYKLKLKLNLIFYGQNSFDSIDLIYKNSNWLERETSEMYNIHFYKKRDSRKLLLDYTLDVNPMLKDYPTEGEYDCYYSNIEHQVVLEKHNVIEL